MTKYMNLDSNESVFFESELEHIKARSYDVVYPELMFDKVFPISSEVSSGAETITYRQYDHVGHAKLIHSYANDLPVVNVKGAEFTRKVYSQGISFGYSLQDIRASQYAGKALDQRLANAARKQMMSLTNDLAFYGDDSVSMPPFINNPNVNAYVVPQNAGSTGTEWDKKTPDEIIADINGAATMPRLVTKGVERVTHMLLPDEQYGHIASTPRSSTSDTTILDFVLKTNPWITSIMPCYELAGAGAAGKDCFIMYNKSADKLTLEIPLQYEMLPVQEKGLYYEVPAHSRIAGVIIYYPKSIVQADGI